MKNSYQQVSITVNSEDVKEILLALLADAAYEGFVDERTVLKAYIPSIEFDAETLEEILQPFEVSYSVEEIEQRNWNAEWEAGFHPVIVEDYCTIRADFHEPVKGIHYDIIITPKMSFGTGHHATTYMMVDAMRGMEFKGKKILDFGTGTGVLAILAEKMGATEILAIDNDDWSIENARENIERNQCKHIELKKADTIPAAESFHIIIAHKNKKFFFGQRVTNVKKK